MIAVQAHQSLELKHPGGEIRLWKSNTPLELQNYQPYNSCTTMALEPYPLSDPRLKTVGLHRNPPWAQLLATEFKLLSLFQYYSLPQLTLLLSEILDLINIPAPPSPWLPAMGLPVTVTIFQIKNHSTSTKYFLSFFFAVIPLFLIPKYFTSDTY